MSQGKPAIMEKLIGAAVRSYQQQSLLSMEQVVQKGALDKFTGIFINIAKEVDDSQRVDTSFSVLKAYKNASVMQKAFLNGVLTELNKPHNAFEVFDVLERWGIFSEDENIAIWEENLERRRIFSEELEKAATDLLERAQESSMSVEGRTDLLHIRSFAIDKASTTDADDAISYDPKKDAVLVHIADPAEYFSAKNDHALVKEASQRVLTIYVGQRKFSLFPENVSHNLFSLTGGSEGKSFATTYEFRILQNGEIDTDSMSVYSSVIAKPVCLTHQEAGSSLKNPSISYGDDIHKLYELALLRLNCRLAKCANPTKNRARSDTEEGKARLLVDEMMIATNVVAAKLAQKRRIPILYRGVGGRQGLGSSRMSTFRGTRYTCSMWGTSTRNRDMEKEANVKLNTLPMRHATLGVDEYVQVTSPIRKLGDLIVNFQFNAMHRGCKLPFGSLELKIMEKRILEMERVAGRVARRGRKYRSYQRLLQEGTKEHRGVLRGKKRNEREGYRDLMASEWKRLGMRKRDEWIVFLKDVGCDIVATVPFEAQRGMEVRVLVNEVIPRTSYIDAQILKV